MGILARRRKVKATGPELPIDSAAYYYAVGAQKELPDLVKTLALIDTADAGTAREAEQFCQSLNAMAVPLVELETQLERGSRGELSGDIWKTFPWATGRGGYRAFGVETPLDDPRAWRIGGIGAGTQVEYLVWEGVELHQRVCEEWLEKHLPGKEGEPMRELLRQRRHLLGELREIRQAFDEYAQRAYETLHRQQIVKAAALIDPPTAPLDAQQARAVAAQARDSLEAIATGIDVGYFGLSEEQRLALDE